MEDNPYAPPKAVVADTVERMPAVVPPGTLLYSVQQIALATFFGTPAAGGWLIARNYKALGQAGRAQQNLAWCIVATLALFGLAFVLPERVPNYLVAIVPVVAVRAWADAQFGKVLGQHRAAGGKLYSWWRVVGLGLLFLCIVVAAIFTVIALLYMFGIFID